MIINCEGCGEDFISTNPKSTLCSVCLEAYQVEETEWQKMQDVSPEKLAGELFEDKLFLYHNEY